MMVPMADMLNHVSDHNANLEFSAVSRCRLSWVGRVFCALKTRCGCFTVRTAWRWWVCVASTPGRRCLTRMGRWLTGSFYTCTASPSRTPTTATRPPTFPPPTCTKLPCKVTTNTPFSNKIHFHQSFNTHSNDVYLIIISSNKNFKQAVCRRLLQKKMNSYDIQTQFKKEKTLKPKFTSLHMLWFVLNLLLINLDLQIRCFQCKVKNQRKKIWQFLHLRYWTPALTFCNS